MAARPGQLIGETTESTAQARGSNKPARNNDRPAESYPRLSSRHHGAASMPLDPRRKPSDRHHDARRRLSHPQTSRSPRFPGYRGPASSSAILCCWRRCASSDALRSGSSRCCPNRSANGSAVAVLLIPTDRSPLPDMSVGIALLARHSGLSGLSMPALLLFAS